MLMILVSQLPGNLRQPYYEHIIMIVERRRQVRKSYQNYIGSPEKSGVLKQPDSAINLDKPDTYRKITYLPVNFSPTTSTDWEDDSLLTTETTPSFIVYGYAFLTALSFFLVGYSFFAD